MSHWKDVLSKAAVSISGSRAWTVKKKRASGSCCALGQGRVLRLKALRQKHGQDVLAARTGRLSVKTSKQEALQDLPLPVLLCHKAAFLQASSRSGKAAVKEKVIGFLLAHFSCLPVHARLAPIDLLTIPIWTPLDNHITYGEHSPSWYDRGPAVTIALHEH